MASVGQSHRDAFCRRQLPASAHHMVGEVHADAIDPAEPRGAGAIRWRADRRPSRQPPRAYAWSPDPLTPPGGAKHDGASVRSPVSTPSPPTRRPIPAQGATPNLRQSRLGRDASHETCQPRTLVDPPSRHRGRRSRRSPFRAKGTRLGHSADRSPHAHGAVVTAWDTSVVVAGATQPRGSDGGMAAGVWPHVWPNRTGPPAAPGRGPRRAGRRRAHRRAHPGPARRPRRAAHPPRRDLPRDGPGHRHPR